MDRGQESPAGDATAADGERLPRATRVLAAGTWETPSACDRVVLDYDGRHRRRLRFVAEGGTVFLLDLPRAAVLREGDGLQFEDGRVVRVAAAREPVLRISTADPAQLARLAWHIGNRHLPAQITPGCILIREDGVIADMLRGLGARVERIHSEFTPEPGAYEAGHSHHLLLRNGHEHGGAP
ncbi:MAG TPA: urease accessory protein UreE [Steroidobacteraceae bacterium]|nr:urease accessory protein UreE [Steroidobacteraceae bacterium]